MKDDLITILLAEDDPEDGYLIGEALYESRIASNVVIVEDGEELLDYLLRRGKYADPESSPRPGLILLDLNMPRKDGREALVEIKQHPHLRRIPVVVLTTSQAEEDIFRTYDIGISGYITKPASFTALREAMKAVGNYWLQVVSIPTE